MSEVPRWYRRQMLENKLSVLKNPYADVSEVQAAKKAVELKLDEQEREYCDIQYRKTNDYLGQL